MLAKLSSTMWLPGSSARRLPAIALALLISKANLGHAACECGYTSTVATGPTARDWVLFTDLIETDFSREDDVMLNTDWRPQKYDVDKEMARGEYGQQFALRNVDPNPAENPEENSGPGVNGGDSGLILTVESQIVDGMVPGGQIVSSRQDVLHGTFRAGMKLTGISGTCAAFFWVRTCDHSAGGRHEVRNGLGRLTDGGGLNSTSTTRRK